MKVIYPCTAAMLMILAGVALFHPRVMTTGPDSATTPNAVSPANPTFRDP
jgi:hypothetical protein